ncbi:MAG: hypothetical protein ACLS9K_06795 [Lachnospira eligens]
MPILWEIFSLHHVNITTEQVYAVKSYGTSASPFYTILALWFGGLILVAIMHTLCILLQTFQQMQEI